MPDAAEERSTTGTSERLVEQELSRLRQEVMEARELLEFAIADGRAVEDRIVAAIKRAETFLTRPSLPDAEERTAFEQAYRDLAKAMAPVTVHTLRATSDRYGRRFLSLRPISEGKVLSRKLSFYTIAFVLFALIGENTERLLSQFFPADEETEGAILTWHMFSVVFQSLVPFTYGGIGACAYLLRACHGFIYKREFDPNRVPEYYSRILLGVVSGGAILLFIEQVTTAEGAVKLSAAALAFLAGYNTDFLFTTIERIVNAILPKVGIETVRRAAPVTMSASLDTLLERYARAQTPEEKKLIGELIETLKGKL